MHVPIRMRSRCIPVPIIKRIHPTNSLIDHAPQSTDNRKLDGDDDDVLLLYLAGMERRVLVLFRSKRTDNRENRSKEQNKCNDEDLAPLELELSL